MVNPEHLRQGALRAYELGRLYMALRAAWILIPIGVVCALETGASEKCFCISAVLLGAAVFLRWRSRRHTESVRDGLLAGSIPLLAGLAIGRLIPCCRGPELVSICASICLGAGALSGIWLGLRLARGKATLSGALAAAGIAVLSASLGCVGLGLEAIGGAAGGLVLGTIATASLTRAIDRWRR